MKLTIRKFLFFLVAMAISCLGSSTFATSRAGSVSTTLAGGYEFFDSKRPVQNAALPYIILGYNVTDQWGAEVLGGIFSTRAKDSADKRRVNGRLFAFDGIYHFPSYRFIEPFILAGVGVTGLNPNANEANYQGNANIGAGALLFVNQAVAFRVEARDLYTITGGKNDVLLGAGVTFLFDVC